MSLNTPYQTINPAWNSLPVSLVQTYLYSNHDTIPPAFRRCFSTMGKIDINEEWCVYHLSAMERYRLDISESIIKILEPHEPTRYSSHFPLMNWESTVLGSLLVHLPLYLRHVVLVNHNDHVALCRVLHRSSVQKCGSFFVQCCLDTKIWSHTPFWFCNRHHCNLCVFFFFKFVMQLVEARHTDRIRF